jgi:DNA-damage-inducible protein D
MKKELIVELHAVERKVTRICTRGHRAFFGGRTTEQMKKRLKVPDGRPLADFLPAITIKAKDLANEITNFNIKRDDLRTEGSITGEHVRSNVGVRTLLKKRGIVPGQLPAAEDVKKVERRVESEQKKLPKMVKSLDVDELDSQG